MSATAASVLDASALLAYLHGEPGAAAVSQALTAGAAIGAVNWAEVLSKLAEVGQDPDRVTRDLASQGLLGSALMIHALDESMAREIARLRPLTRSRGLSLGDRACLALGRLLGLPVLTADGGWEKLSVGVKVRAIR